MNNAGAGMAMGIAIGVALGVALDNIALGIALGMVAGLIFDAQNKKKAKEQQDKQDALANSSKSVEGGNPEQKEAKGRHLEEILAYAQGKESVTNNEIEELLAVSDATAERYLNELEKEGKLEQVGKTGKSVYYKIK